MEHLAKVGDAVAASLEMNAAPGHEVGTLTHIWDVECFDAQGNLKWREHFRNLVTTAGKNKYLDSTIKTGVTSPTWFVGLKGTGTAVVGDTMASHGGWTEIYTTYSQGTRPAYTAGTISGGSVDNSASKAVFSFTGTDTIYGCFLANNSTKNGSTGDLLSAGDFGASRGVVNQDTLNVQVTLTIA